MDHSTLRKVAVKEEEDGADISFAEIDIELPDIKEECLERSTLGKDSGPSNTKKGNVLVIESQQNWCPDGFKLSQSTAKLPTVRFSADEDERLIEFVRNHAILYDLKDPEYKNTMKKDLIWNKAGKVLKKEGNDCKKRWKSIRDHYKREKSTGKSAKKKRALYWERLQFLDTMEDERNSFTNVLFSSDNETSTFIVPTDIVELKEEEVVDPPVQAAQGSSRQESAQQTQARNTTPSPESQRSNDGVFRHPKSKIKKENVFLQQFMKDRQKEREHFKRCLEELVAHPGHQENEIDMFFKTMAATVKKFRPDLATQTKARVFKVVTEMEVLNQQSPFPHSTIQYNENQSSYSSSSGSSSPWTTQHSP